MTNAGENVAVLLTPPGVAAIAVLRLAGPMNDAFAAAHLSRAPKTNHCVHADLHDDGDVLDDVIAVRTADGHLDLNLHGGAWVVHSALRLAGRNGYRIAAASETIDTDIATDDPIDAITRRVLNDLPRARSHAVLKLLTAQPAAWQAMLAGDDRDAMRRALADTALERSLGVPSVAIVGTPNVGKSTLANALFGTERSITADVPGTTRDWVGDLADLDGLVVRLIDTPGVRPTPDPIEAAAIRQATDVVRGAECVVIAIDGSRALEAGERRLLAERANAVIVRTKADRPTRCEPLAAAIDVCAPNGVGLRALRDEIRNRLGVADLHSTHARCWTDAQREYLRTRL